MKKFWAIFMALLLCFGQAEAIASAAAAKPAAANTAAAAKTAAAKGANGAQQQAAGPMLNNIRYGDGAEKLRIVLDVSSLPEYLVSRENNNTRLVVTLNGISTDLKAAPATRSSVLKDIILGTYGSDTVQLIVDMKVPLDAKVYKLQNPDRLVIDIQKEYEKEFTRNIAQGLDYTKYVRLDSRGMVTAYSLEIDRSMFDIRLALAGGSISAGRASVKKIAQANNALAAINGGYFGLDGMLIGNTRLDGQTAGTTYYTRTSLGFMPDGTLKLAPSEYYGEVAFNGKKVFLSGVNCERGANTTILYNSLFGSYTKTNEYGTEYVVKDGKVIGINQGNSFIPAGAQVISVHGTAQEAFAGVKIGDKVTIGESFGKELDAAQNIIGAGPELLRDGRVNITAAREQFPNDIARGRAPRTAAGIKADGKVILLVVDGRQSHSIGATLTETAQLLQKFGAVNGFNLDGGGSSEMVLQGQIMNSPSDGGERAVGSAIIVTGK